MADKLAMHETLEIHELITMRATCGAKAASMVPLAKDEQLKTLLQTDVTLTKKALEELKDLIEVG
ncbi:spore coat protein [Paenibacillus wulumuqiensis]|uniref:spore coat protein n=1 Tax=Paenibacillus wulumuqiensis TaxID=1567107 RepID=UPI000619FFDB|nr:spore coat protein [Paenibacillus wulumuqiensis]